MICCAGGKCIKSQADDALAHNALSLGWAALLLCTLACPVQPHDRPLPTHTTHPAQRLGWQAVSVPFYDWWRLTPGQRGPYMRRKLQEAGLQLEAGGSGQGAEGSEAQQQRQQQKGRRRQEQRQQGLPQHGRASGQRQPPASQSHRQAEQGTSQPLPQLAAAFAQQEQHPAAEAADAGAGSTGGVEADEGSPPAGLAQRAQRLSMMQYKKGKLSKAGLLARGSLQAAAAGGKLPSGDAGSSSGSDDASGSSGDAPPAP